MTRILFVLILFALPAQAQILFPGVVPPAAAGGGSVTYYGSTESVDQTGSASGSFSFDVGSNSNRYLVVFIHSLQTGSDSSRAVSITYNGTNLTMISRALALDNLGLVTEVWGLANPTSGSNTVAWTMTETPGNGVEVAAVAAYNVHQTTSYGSEGSSASIDGGTTIATSTITSGTGELIIASCAAYTSTAFDVASDAGQTERQEDEGFWILTNTATKTGTSTTCSWTMGGSNTYRGSAWISLKPN